MKKVYNISRDKEYWIIVLRLALASERSERITRKGKKYCLTCWTQGGFRPHVYSFSDHPTLEKWSLLTLGFLFIFFPRPLWYVRMMNARFRRRPQS